MGKSTLRRLAWKLLTLSLLTSFVFLLPKERVAQADSCAESYYYCSQAAPWEPYSSWVSGMTQCDLNYMACGGGGAPAPFPLSPELSPWETVYRNCTVIGIVPEQHVPEFLECLANEGGVDGCCYMTSNHYR
jgi:hypothetical protein